MAEFTYRYCQYIPSLSSPAERFDFAVAVASEGEVVLLGLDLGKFGVSHELPPGFPNVKPFTSIHHRIMRILSTEDPATGYELLEKLDNRSPNNVALSELGRVTSDLAGTFDQANLLFKKIAAAMSEHKQYEEGSETSSDSGMFFVGNVPKRLAGDDASLEMCSHR